MRRARCSLMLVLALSPLLVAGSTSASAGVRVGVHASVVVPTGPYGYYWDPFWYSYPGPGWGFAYYYPYAPPPYGAYAPRPPRNVAPVQLHVSPRKSDVTIDGTNVGQARDFDSAAYPLWLKPGTHTLELSRPGYQMLRVRLVVQRGRAYRVHYDLREGGGLDPRSAQPAPEPKAKPEPS